MTSMDFMFIMASLAVMLIMTSLEFDVEMLLGAQVRLWRFWRKR